MATALKSRIRVVQDDITAFAGDAIVNAANRSLLGGGGVDGAIHRAAGAGLLAACRALNGCETGAAKLTPAFDLPCKYVIHTVGPVWQGGAYGEPEQLASCYRAALTLAQQQACRRVAFPAISCGVYGYPAAAAQAIAARSICEWLASNDQPDEVTLVCFSVDMYAVTLAAVATALAEARH